MFVRAWRHVVEIFRKHHVANVVWVWSPNVDCGGRCPFTAFYPGRAWVDWVALDGYNYGTGGHSHWRSFVQVFGRSYATLSRMTSKPIMIAETASAEAGGSKAAWIRGMGLALASGLHRVRVLIWFDRIKETDWRVGSSVSSLQAIRTLVASPLFGG